MKLALYMNIGIIGVAILMILFALFNLHQFYYNEIEFSDAWIRMIVYMGVVITMIPTLLFVNRKIK